MTRTFHKLDKRREIPSDDITVKTKEEIKVEEVREKLHRLAQRATEEESGRQQAVQDEAIRQEAIRQARQITENHGLRDPELNNTGRVITRPQTPNPTNQDRWDFVRQLMGRIAENQNTQLFGPIVTNTTGAGVALDPIQNTSSGYVVPSSVANEITRFQDVEERRAREGQLSLGSGSSIRYRTSPYLPHDTYFMTSNTFRYGDDY